MKLIKMALLGGAALAVSAAAAHADDLDALKFQIETLNARVAAMEASPSVPAGYQLLTISEGDFKQIPGLGDQNEQDMRALGSKSTVISVLPTADAPAGTTVTWSGRVTSALVYTTTDRTIDISFSDPYDAEDVFGINRNDEAFSEDGDYSLSGDSADLDVIARARLRVTAATDTAVGEVGVTMELRGNFNGNGTGDTYFETAWGWAMTPELTLGGGYAGSLGNIGYGYDGVCSCYEIDAADAFSLNPGDTTQMRLSYASGPFSMAVALEDAGRQGAFGNGDDNASPNYVALGVAGEIKYSGDMFSGEIAGVWRGVHDDEYSPPSYILDSPELEDTWQVGAGVGFGLGDIAKVSIGAAMGSGPQTSAEDGLITTSVPVQGDWWGVSGALVFSLTDQFSAELGAAYKSRESEGGTVYQDDGGDIWEFSGADYDQWAVAGGLYYTPVEQLTLGVEGEWSTAEASTSGDELNWGDDYDTIDIDVTTEKLIVDFVGVWRF